MRRSSFLTWLVVSMIVAGSGVCWAQAVRATLVGRVTDQSGAVVPGTKLTLVNAGTNEIVFRHGVLSGSGLEVGEKFRFGKSFGKV